MRRLLPPALPTALAALGLLAGMALAWGLFRYWVPTGDRVLAADSGRLVEVSGDAWLLAALVLSNTLLVCMACLLWKRIGSIPPELAVLSKDLGRITATACHYDRSKATTHLTEQASAASRLEEIQKGLTGVVSAVSRIQSMLTQQKHRDDDPPRLPAAAPTVTRQRTFDDAVQDYCAGGISHANLISTADRLGLRWGSASAHADTTDRIALLPRSDDRRVLYFERAPNSLDYILILKDGATWDMNLATWFNPAGAALHVLDHGPRVSTEQPAICRLESGLIRVLTLGLARVHDI